MGNLRSVQKALARVGGEADISDKPEDVSRAERLVIPGVGAFGDAMRALAARDLVEPIRAFARRGRPVLGICLGLQVFFDESEESDAAPERSEGERGLGLVAGRVVRFDETMGLKVPHMGWNTVRVVRPSPLFEGMPAEGTYFYFAHSYYAAPRQEDVVIGRTEYGVSFASAVGAGNVVATQFHPEKSQAAGLAVLENFVKRF